MVFHFNSRALVCNDRSVRFTVGRPGFSFLVRETENVKNSIHSFPCLAVSTKVIVCRKAGKFAGFLFEKGNLSDDSFPFTWLTGDETERSASLRKLCKQRTNVLPFSFVTDSAEDTGRRTKSKNLQSSQEKDLLVVLTNIDLLVVDTRSR